jgi:hypothetical protein
MAMFIATLSSSGPERRNSVTIWPKAKGIVRHILLVYGWTTEGRWLNHVNSTVMHGAACVNRRVQLFAACKWLLPGLYLSTSEPGACKKRSPLATLFRPSGLISG